ncbi:MAG TPA: DarT ssDNA thymidine ADP-ribosyltransferase family protein [Acidimicrobiales bacterium]|nr:DarT ssDNA thymidine ADP-ribosyltransferase family protein [Acidimicrobiales bacterium]
MVISHRTPAQPRSSAEIATLLPCPEVVEAARRRGITEIVHFTTIQGAVGILASRRVKSRQRLPSDRYLEHVYRPNAKTRSRDAAWLDYVNLSISRINDWMFDTSERWHIADGVSWVVLSFTIEILGHPGVVFTSTNNIYPACRRGEGLDGFSRLFDDVVLGRYSTRHTRHGLSDYFTTDRQAEVLYPGELSIDHLQRIDVQVEEALYDIEGALGGLGLQVPVRHAPEVFE